MSFDIDAPAPGPAGELRVLPRRDVGMRLAVELREPFQQDTAGGHVDAQRERLGSEHGPDQAPDEQFLDGLLENRDQAGVVRGHAATQPVEPLPVSEHLEILGGMPAVRCSTSAVISSRSTGSVSQRPA